MKPNCVWFCVDVIVFIEIIIIIIISSTFTVGVYRQPRNCNQQKSEELKEYGLGKRMEAAKFV